MARPLTHAVISVGMDNGISVGSSCFRHSVKLVQTLVRRTDTKSKIVSYYAVAVVVVAVVVVVVVVVAAAAATAAAAAVVAGAAAYRYYYHYY